MDRARLGTAGRCAPASLFSVVAVAGSNDPVETAETAPGRPNPESFAAHVATHVRHTLAKSQSMIAVRTLRFSLLIWRCRVSAKSVVIPGSFAIACSFFSDSRACLEKCQSHPLARLRPRYVCGRRQGLIPENSQNNRCESGCAGNARR